MVEFNAIHNIKLLCNNINDIAINKIIHQLDLLERYLLAREADLTVKWYEVLNNPKKYPNLKEKFKT